MIRKLRRKFVFVFMMAVTAFLIVLLIGLYLSNAAHYRQASMETAHSAMLEGTRVRGSMPLIIAEVDPAGRMCVLLNQIYFMTEDEIAKIIAEIKGSGYSSGELAARNLRFLCREMGPGRLRYVLVDAYGEKMALRAQAFSSAGIGFAVFLGFLAISLFLSRWIVRPVAEAWTKQRQFVADASHELKTPLTVALSNVDMLLSETEADPGSKNCRRLDITKIELLRMKDLVEKLLRLARADAQDIQIAAEPFCEIDLSHLVICSLASFEPVFYDAGRQIDSDIAPGCHTVGDPDKLSELLSILLDNACKYSAPESTVMVRLQHKNSREILLTIENDCVDFPSAELPHIFDRFYRADRSRGEVSGYGLGLSIAQEIVKQQGGKIWAESFEKRIAFRVLFCRQTAFVKSRRHPDGRA